MTCDEKMKEYIVVAWAPADPPSCLKRIKPGDVHLYRCDKLVLVEPQKWISCETGIECFEDIEKFYEVNGRNFLNYIDFYSAEIKDVIKRERNFVLAKKVKITGFYKVSAVHPKI